MRAFLAVAVLAVAKCRAATVNFGPNTFSQETIATLEAIDEIYGNFLNIDDERWSDDERLALLHLKLKVDDGGHVLSEGDIDLIIKGLDELPAQRSDIFGILAKHIGAYKTMIDENHVIRQAIYDDPLFSRLKEKEAFEWLLDLAARERDQCADTRVQKTARMCEDFRDQLGKLFLILLAQTGVDPAFDSLVDSHAAEIMEAFQGASANEVNMARSLLYEDPDRESESDATKAFRAIRDDYALSTPAGGLSENAAIDPKGVMGYGSKFHTACTGLTSPAEAVEAVRVALDSGVDVNSKNRD